MRVDTAAWPTKIVGVRQGSRASQGPDQASWRNSSHPHELAGGDYGIPFEMTFGIAHHHYLFRGRDTERLRYARK